MFRFTINPQKMMGLDFGTAERWAKWRDYVNANPGKEGILDMKGEPKQRTGQQNAALHLWLEMIAKELNNQGQTVQNVVAKIEKAEIIPTGDNLKEVLWRPAQIAATKKVSSRDLTKDEVTLVYEVLNKFLGQHFEIHVPFPSIDNAPPELGYIKN